jgi:hypothetical protein
MLHSDSHTSWGSPQTEVDARVLRMYCKLLSRCALVGEILNPLLICLLLTFATLLIVFTDWEKVSFYDGTERVCVMDGAKQGSPYVR